MSVVASGWRPFDASAVTEGEVSLRFSLPNVDADNAWLFLAGLGTRQARLVWPDG
jgi:hypothetical protein